MALFTTPLHCIQRTDVLLPGVTSETMSLILEYAYRRSVDINQENVRTLLVSADYLSVPGLLELCCDFLKSILTPENCIGIMLFARDHSFSLEEDVRCFVMRNFVQVSQQSDELLELPPEDLKAIIGADELNVKSEEVVWASVLRWISHDKENRKGNIVELIKKVRLGLLDPNFVRGNIQDHPYVAGNDECCAIIKPLLGLEMITKKEGDISDRELARPRIPHEILFTVGGWKKYSAMNYIQTYDTRANRWVKVEEIEPTFQRAFHGTAVIGFNIYVIGGCNNKSNLNSCHCFNALAKTWCEVSPMHERRGFLSVAVLDGLVYAMGGSLNSKTAERYDYRTNRWSMIAPMNKKRFGASAATLNGKIYIAGGLSGGNELNSAEVYDSEVNQWTFIKSMMSVRGFPSCIAYHGYIYAIGGYNGKSFMCSGEKYDPTTNTWMRIPDMSQPRASFGIAVIDDVIFAIGGRQDGEDDEDGTLTNAVECYDEKSNEWIGARDMNIFASGLSACVIMGLPNVRDYIKCNKD
jgi:kelch-like protein 10